MWVGSAITTKYCVERPEGIRHFEGVASRYTTSTGNISFMAPTQASIDLTLAHPIDLVTRFVVRQDWLVQKQDQDAVLAEIPGRWSDYQLAVSWQDGEETMLVVCRIDMRADRAQLGELAMLAALLNQQLYIGHLALDMSSCELELRHTLALRGAGGATPEQVEDVVDIMLGECEQVYPAIYQVVSGALNAGDAAAAVMMITEGEA
jgi:hypothetical protein